MGITHVDPTGLIGLEEWESDHVVDGDAAHTYVGKTTAGASNEAMVATRQYMKQITLSAAGLLASVGVHARLTVDAGSDIRAAVLADDGGAPGKILAYSDNGTSAMVWESDNTATDAAAWITRPLGVFLTAGTYWLAIQGSTTNLNIYYDTGGSDPVMAVSGGHWFADGGRYTVTDSTKNYSIRGSIIATAPLAPGPQLLGKTTEGASYQTMPGDLIHIAKKLTMPSAGILYPPAGYFKTGGSVADLGFASSFWTDDGGSGSASRPLRPKTGHAFTTGTRLLDFATTEIGWITPGGAQPIWVESGEIIWAVIGCSYQSAHVQIAYDTGGVDLQLTFTTAQSMGVVGGHADFDATYADTTRNHSIRCPFSPAP